MFLGTVFYILLASCLFYLAVLDRKCAALYPVTSPLKRQIRFKLPSKIVVRKKREYLSVPYLTPYMLLILLIFAFVAAIRFRVGPDCENYVDSYYAIAQDNNYLLDQEFEPAFVWICRALGFLGLGRVGFLGFWGLVEIFLFTYALKDRRNILPYALYILMLCPFFLSWMNGMRQVAVSLVFLLLSVLLIERNWKPVYIAGILLCMLMHKSAVILLPLVFLANAGMLRHRYVLIPILLCMTALGQTDFVNRYLDDFSPLLEMLHYDSYADRIEYYAEIDNNFSFGPRRIVLLCLNCAAVWFSGDMRKYYGDGLLNWSFNLFFIYACFKDGILSNASSLFWRPFLYLEVFQLLTYAYLLHFLVRKYGIRHFITLAALFLMSVYVPIECVSVRNEAEETSIYKTILSPDYYDNHQ